jgi:hypothetical protein
MREDAEEIRCTERWRGRAADHTAPKTRPSRRPGVRTLVDAAVAQCLLNSETADNARANVGRDAHTGRRCWAAASHCRLRCSATVVPLEH